MTAITYVGATPTVGGDADTWGTELNVSLAQIAADLSMLNTTPTATIIGRVTAATGEAERLTGAQANTILPAVVGDSGSGGTKGLVPAPAAGDTAARKFLRADATWVADERKAWGVITCSTGALVAGRNVSTSRSSIGTYVVTFTTNLPSTNYAVVFGLSAAAIDVRLPRLVDSTKAVSGFTAVIATASGTAIDATEIYFDVIAA